MRDSERLPGIAGKETQVVFNKKDSGIQVQISLWGPFVAASSNSQSCNLNG